MHGRRRRKQPRRGRQWRHQRFERGPEEKIWTNEWTNTCQAICFNRIMHPLNRPFSKRKKAAKSGYGIWRSYPLLSPQMLSQSSRRLSWLLTCWKIIYASCKNSVKFLTARYLKSSFPSYSCCSAGDSMVLLLRAWSGKRSVEEWNRSARPHSSYLQDGSDTGSWILPRVHWKFNNRLLDY